MTKKSISNIIKGPNAPMFVFMLVTALGSAAPFAFLATYLARVGMTQVQISTILALFPVAAIASQFLWGIIADKSKTINTVMSLQLGGIVLSAILMFISRGFLPMLISVLLYSFFYSALYPLIDTVCIDMVNKGQLANYGNIRVMTSLGYSFSVWFSGIASEAFPASIFIIMGGFTAIALLVSFKIPVTLGERKKGEKFNSLKFFAKREVFIPLITYLVLELVYSSINSSMPIYVSIDLGLGEGFYGLFMAIRVAGEFLVLPFTRRIQRLLSYRKAYIFFMLCSVVGIGVCAFTDNTVVLLLASCIMGVSCIGALTWLVNYLGNLAPAHGKATVQSHTWLGFSIAQILGNYSIRFFTPTVGSPIYFYVTAAIMAFGAGLMLFAKIDKEASHF